MNRFWLSVILISLHITISLGQERDDLERLRLEDLIGVPALKPKQARGLPGMYFHLPHINSPLQNDFQLSRLNLPREIFLKKQKKPFTLYAAPNSPFFNNRIVTGNAEVRYQLKGNFSLFLSGSYYTDKYKSPMLPLSVSNKEVEAGLSYMLTKRLRLKTGVQYRFNIIKKRWEWVSALGVTYSF